MFDVALQCGIVTDTTVKSSGGTQSAATARANIAVRVLADGDPAEPDNGFDANKENAEGVVFCDRIQTLAAKIRRTQLHGRPHDRRGHLHGSGRTATHTPYPERERIQLRQG